MSVLKNYVKVIVEQEAVHSSIYDIDIRADNLEEELLKLFSNIDDLESLKGELKYDVNSLFDDMNKLKHNDDMFHHGETIMDHTREVLEDLEEYIEDMDEDRKRLLRLVAVLHDIGKAVSYGWNEEKNKPTFHGHAEESMKIAERMLAKYKDESEELLQNILELVKEHDVFLKLVDQRGKSKNLKYLKNFSNKSLSVGKDLENIVAIAKADNKRARSAEKDFKAIQGIVDDLSQYRIQAKEREEEEIRLKAKAKENVIKYKDEILDIAKNVSPEAKQAFPDIKAMNRVFGMNKQYDAIKKIKDILGR